MPVTSIANPFALHWRTSIRNREAEQAATMHHWCLSKAAQAAATTGPLFKVSALKLRILSPIQVSMKTFISNNQLQNKSLKQIMFFLHISSPLSPFNTKCPWFKKKKKNSRRNSLLFYLDPCLCLSYVLKILSRRFKEVCWTFLFTRHVLGFFCLLLGFVVGVSYLKTSKGTWYLEHTHTGIFGKACLWLLKDNLNSEVHALNHITSIFLLNHNTSGFTLTIDE